jgi:uncharacterized protein YuzE
MRVNAMYITYDTEADAAYVRLGDDDASVGARRLDERRYLHLDADGVPVAVEFLFISQGVDFEGIPRAEEIRAALKELGALAAA